MSLTTLVEELLGEVKQPVPNRKAILQLTLQLNEKVFSQDHSDYVAHLWDLTFNDTTVNNSVKYWFVHWVKQGDSNTISGHKNLRLMKTHKGLRFVKADTEYDNCRLKDIPKHMWKDDDFNSNYYLAIEGYIRKNCDLECISQEWLRQPYLI